VTLVVAALACDELYQWPPTAYIAAA